MKEWGDGGDAMKRPGGRGGDIDTRGIMEMKIHQSETRKRGDIKKAEQDGSATSARQKQ